jgi:hypothetical protein
MQTYRFANADDALDVALYTSQYRFANLNVTLQRRDFESASKQHLMLVKGSESRKRFKVEGGKDAARTQACVELASGCS